MTQNSIKKIEETIYRDGSLSEERKTQLLNLLTTMKPEVTEKKHKSQAECAENIVRFNTVIYRKYERQCSPCRRIWI